MKDTHCRTASRRPLAVGALALGLLTGTGLCLGQTGGPPVKVTVEQGKAEVREPAGPVVSQVVITPQFVGQMAYGLLGQGGKRLTFAAGSARTAFLVDRQTLQPGGAQQPLPGGAAGKRRPGVLHTSVHGDIHVTQTIEIVPGKRGEKVPPGTKRFLDTLLVRYTIKNRGQRPHAVAARVRIDMYNVDNDGCLFAAPATFPGKILDGVTLKGPKEVPPYLLSLQRPNLKQPGNVAYFTFKLGSRVEPPGRVVCTWHGAPYNVWDVPAMQAMGDSDIVLYWDSRPLQPGGKRELAYAYGEGIAAGPGSEGRVTVAFGGSFAPRGLFTVTAYVDDPLESQSLTLELPPGMEPVEGNAVQPVPPPEEAGRSVVVWKARVLGPGRYPVRIRSSTGVTETRTVTITPAAGAAPAAPPDKE
jgi:hypothetical protein